jgi:hypothetical protein
VLDAACDDYDHSVAGVALEMLKDYSDFVDTMAAAAAATDDTSMQPFVAWCVQTFIFYHCSAAAVCPASRCSIRYGKASIAWASPKSSSIETLLKLRSLCCIDLVNIGMTSSTCCAFAEVLMLLPPHQISSLNLSANAIHDLGVASIAFAVDRCSALTKLTLSSAKINAPGAAAIASAMSPAGGSDGVPTRAAILQLPSNARAPIAVACKRGDAMPGCAASDAPHIEQLQLQLLQQGQGRHHSTTGATGLWFLHHRFLSVFDRQGTGYKMQVIAAYYKHRCARNQQS